jgi:hypothetical protein
VRPRRRKTLSLLASLVGHVVLVGGFANGFALRCVPDLELPDLEFEFAEVELVDPEALQGEDVTAVPEPPPPAPPQPVTPAEPAPSEPEGPKPPPEPEPAPEPPPEPPKFAAKGSEADKLAPPQSTWHILLVPKKIRTLSFSQQVLDIMAPLPDFELLIDKGRFDALRDFDHIVVASPDIRDWTQTFLAVDYKISRAEVQRAIERAAAANDEVIEWIEDGGLLRGNPRPRDPQKEDADDRWFVFLEGKVAIYVREEFLPSILADGSDGRKTAGSFVANLAKLRRFAARQPEAGMQIVIKDIRRVLKKNPLPFQIPDEIELSASATETPEIVIRGDFLDANEAKAFLAWYDQQVEKAKSSLAFKLQAGWLFDVLKVERDGRRVEIRGTFTTEQAALIMQFAADGSRKVAKKTPEQIEQMRQRRIEALKARKNGKLPPSALDPKVDEGKATQGKPPEGKASTDTPPTPPPGGAEPPTTPSTPAQTPAEPPANPSAPG